MIKDIKKVISFFIWSNKKIDKVEHEMTINGKPNENDLISIAIKLKLSISKCNEIISTIKK